MKAARYYGPRDIRIEQIPEPQPGVGQVKVKIAWNGICGSDLHAYLKPMLLYAKEGVPDPVTGESAPVTLGHEFAGTIVGHGEGVDKNKWGAGVNVVIEPIFGCNKTDTCHDCAKGSRSMCPLVNFIGIGGWGGGLAEYIAVDVRFLHVLPQGISLEVGACVEPLAVAWWAVKKSGFKEGQSALVLGAGPIGMFVVKALKALSPNSTIIVSEPAAMRRKLSLEHGATLAIDPLAPGANVPRDILAATGGIGTDVAFDAAGVQQTLEMALIGVRTRGVIVNVAVWENNAKLDFNHLLSKEVILTGTLGYDRIHPEVLEALAAGKFPGIEKLVTKRISIDDVVAQGFETLLAEKDSQVKILVHP